MPYKLIDMFFLLGIGLLIFSSSLFLIFSTKAYSRDLRIIACDVGQGDGYLIIQGSMQVVVDGGPGNKLKKCLEKFLPFFDRRIELIVNTHPQKDHYEGLINVIQAYSVQYFLANEIDASDESYRVLKNLVGSRMSQLIVMPHAKKMRHGLINFDLLWPSGSFITANSRAEFGEKNSLGSLTTENDPNDFSIVIALHYKDFDALFTGDIPPNIADQLVDDVQNIDYELLKVPHHGSKNGLSESLLEALKPEVALISSGKNNSYGHPHKEILEMLEKEDVQVRRTDQEGMIVVETDGVSYRIH